MTLDEAIARLNDKHNHTLVFNPKQLAGFLTELKELREENEKLMSHVCDLQLAYNNELIDGRKAKRLLKAAVNDIHVLLSAIGEPMESINRHNACEICEYNPECVCSIACTIHNGFKHWRFKDEVLKLIEEEEK